MEKKKWIKAVEGGGIYFLIALALVIGYLAIIDIITPAQPLNYTIIEGYAIPDVIIYIVVVSICLAWVLHGFGFIIVRR